jgi:hypothetical protein
MKRFSIKWFVIGTLVHVVASILWMSSALSAGFAALDAGRHGLPIPNFPLWLTVLSWILVPIPRLLESHFHFGLSDYFYLLLLPWSVVIGICCGFLLPHVWRRRHQTPNHAMERTADRCALHF